MFKTKRAKILYLLLSLVPLLLAAVFYTSLPAEIPMNWGMNGEVTYSEKKWIWAATALSALIGLMFMYLPLIDPRKENYEKFRDSYNTVAVIFQLFMITVTGIILVESFLPGTLSVENIVIGMVGLLLIFLGNMLPKFKNNYFIGFRTPWALSHPDVWNKTQRLGGYCFCLTGLVCLVLTVLPLVSEIRLTILLVVLAITCILPTVMSCYWFNKLPKNEQKQVFVEIKPGERDKAANLSYSAPQKKTSSGASKNTSGKKKKKKK